MEKKFDENDTIVGMDGRCYKLIDIDETGDHPVFILSPFDMETDTDEYLYTLLFTDVKYLMWELVSACSGTESMTYGELDFLLDKVCLTLRIDYKMAVNLLGEENIIYGELINGNESKEYIAITEAQLAYLCTKSPIKSAKILGEFIIENSSEIKEAVSRINR